MSSAASASPPPASSTIFSALIDEFRENVAHNRSSLLASLKNSPNIVYNQVLSLASFTGSRHAVDLQIHFPVKSKIFEVDSYGTENVSVVVDKFRKRFPISREVIKNKVVEIFGDSANVQDAYMYEGKEGLRILLLLSSPPSGRIELLPGSIHFWCTIDGKVRKFGDWAMANVIGL
jgi:hypothetical protein